MYRAATALCVLAVLGFHPAFGQEQPPADEAQPMIYEAFYAVDYGSVGDWTAQHRAFAVPVLQSLRDEGLISGWSYWRHQTGGDGYNFRLAIRSDWAGFNTFWAEYGSQLREAMPEAEWRERSAMVDRHRDSIWNIEQAGSSESDGEATHLYASTFRVDFPDLDEWNEIWELVVVPTYNRATEAGSLRGWVKLSHNTGGDHNFKVLYFFDGWDQIDDFFADLTSSLADDHPVRFARLNEMLREHDDAIWIPVASVIDAGQ